MYKTPKHFPRSVIKPHRLHLHQHSLLTCTAYTIIAKHKQIGTLTPATLANPSSTQGFLVFIRHPELNSRDAIPSSTRGMYVLNPYPELNSRDTFRAQLKEPSNLTFKASPKAL
ncbi:hypothetical protein DEO72_LG2g3487 [Vigna unguiculata]|uniref:Uncharacterized protein n=1 Tax=Vigna unguiculata TaxID=3917 RepID=A0A4D6L3X8_VIGUN|nr:hypothetical protein DEO72_LG2g3487 [Vigna unguiculata]